MERILEHNHISSPSNNAENKDDCLTRFANILECGHERASKAILFFEKMGGLSPSLVNKAFFQYLGVKKDAQRRVLEKISLSMGLELKPVSWLPHFENSYENAELADESFGDIFTLIHEISADELEFYLAYAAVERNARAHSLLLMMADVAREFLFDVKIWYLNHKEAERVLSLTSHETIVPDYSAETVLN